MIKSPAEISAIKRSVELNSRAFEDTSKHVRPGMRESELAAELDYRVRREGAEGPAFDTIVATGVRTALPHARPTAAKVPARGMILVDMGAMLEGYASDMTRMLFLGRPEPRAKRAYQAVLEAQLAAIDAVRARSERANRGSCRPARFGPPRPGGCFCTLHRTWARSRDP